MFFSVFIRHYLAWHYSDALVAYLRIYKNFFWFFVSYFSLSELTRSFFSPYKRITESRGRGFHLEAWVSALIINTMSRGIGILMRSAIMLAGFTVLLLYSTTALLGYTLWLGAPLIIVVSLIYGAVIAL